MRERLEKLIAGPGGTGIGRWISTVVGAVAILMVASVLVTAWWSTSMAAKGSAIERARTAAGVAEMIAARTDLLLRESDLAGVRRQMIDVQASGLVDGCRVTLSGVGVVASSDPQEIGVMELPASWSASSVTQDATEGRVSVPFVVPQRGSGVVEVRYKPVDAVYAGAMARAFGVGLLAVAAVWLAFRRVRARVTALAAIGTALAEVASGERRAEVLRVGGAVDFCAAWNALLDERDEQDRRIAEHRAVAADLESPGEVGGMVAVCDALSHGMVIVDQSGRVVYVNGAAGVLLGRHRDELHGAAVADVFDDETVRSAVADCFRSRVPVRRAVEVTRGEPGGEPDAELRLMVRSSESGGERFAGVLIEDITQQRVADRSRNAFVAQATHELRTPLTNIRLYVEQAVDEGENDPAVRAQAINVISSEARRLERIVSDMLSVAEIEAGSLTIRTGDVRTDALFDDLRADYAAQAAEKSLELVFDLPPKMPVITGDRDRLGQALHNLVGNALKYTPPGGKVTVRVEAPEAGGLVVHVSDTGIGIDPEECERIFDRFYRANDRRIAHVTGSGLGLALAREIARLHGGDIEVESKLDQGSEFTITVPGAEQVRPQRAA